MKAFLIGITLIASWKPVAHAAAGRVVVWGASAGSVTNVPPGLTNIVSVAGGLDHALALRDDGTVVAWGDDSGYGETMVPVGLSNVVAVSAGWNFSMALRQDGTVATWGDDWLIKPPADLTNVVCIAAGGHQFCLALRADRSVVVWGWSGYGQTNVPTDLTNVVAIAGGLDHCAALRSDGTVAAWGGRDPVFEETNVPAGLSNVVAISAGWAQTLALRADGTVASWGFNASIPVGLNGAVGVAAGWDAYQEFLRKDGTVMHGPSGLTNVVSLSRGHFFAIAITVPGDFKQTLTKLLSNPAWRDGRFRASAKTRYGKIYALEHRWFVNADSGTWLPLRFGNGAVQTLSDDRAAESQGFYRLLEW